MNIRNALYAQNRQDWHDWLERHHQAETELWLIFYKAHTGQACIAYEDAVEEALCFGWIDSIIQKIDEEKYARKFTPRTNTANWSDVNKKRVTKLLREGRMTQAGLDKIPDLAQLEAAPGEKRPRALALPPHLEQALRAHPQAWENFSNLAPSYRQRYIGWITSARRAETMEKCLQEAIRLLEQNRPLSGK